MGYLKLFLVFSSNRSCHVDTIYPVIKPCLNYLSLSVFEESIYNLVFVINASRAFIS